MFDFFNKILGYVELLWTYFTNFIESVVTALQLLLVSMSFPQSLTPLMPPIIGTAIAVFLAIYLIRFMIGR